MKRSLVLPSRRDMLRRGGATVAALFFAPVADALAKPMNPMSRDRGAADFWKTDRARFLDAPQVSETLRAIGDGGEMKSPNETSAALLELMFVELADQRGVHVETAVVCLGAIAGFACQMGIREGLIPDGIVSEKDALVVVETRDGETYYFGDTLNEILTEPRQGNYAVWSLVGGATQSLGRPLPDVVAMHRRAAETVGTPDYGRLDVPDQHQPRYASEDLLWQYWNVARNMMAGYGVPADTRPLFFAHAIQSLILQAKDALDPTLAAKLAMEAAIMMSKISPERVHGAYLFPENAG